MAAPRRCASRTRRPSNFPPQEPLAVMPRALPPPGRAPSARMVVSFAYASANAEDDSRGARVPDTCSTIGGREATGWSTGRQRRHCPDSQTYDPLADPHRQCRRACVHASPTSRAIRRRLLGKYFQHHIPLSTVACRFGAKAARAVLGLSCNQWIADPAVCSRRPGIRTRWGPTSRSSP